MGHQYYLNFTNKLIIESTFMNGICQNEGVKIYFFSKIIE